MILVRITQTDDEKLALAEARLLGQSIIKIIVARNGLHAYWVVRPDGEVREFCYNAENDQRVWSNRGSMFAAACAFAGAGAKHDF